MKVGGDIKPTSTDVSECLPHIKDGICTSDQGIRNMRRYLKHMGDVDSAKQDAIKVVEVLKKKFNVDSESGILADNRFQKFVGTREAKHELETRFKAEGPWDSTALLDNFNIDDTLARWAKISDKAFGKKFYHIPFQMIDFANVGSELARVSIPQLIEGKYDCFGVVLNTDVSSGGGIHWFCIYGDLQHKGTEQDPFRIEFFNSSGNPAVQEVNIWLENTARDIMKDLHKHCKIVRAAPKKLQYSRTECGVWSLMYIKSRLEGNAPNWFFKVNATDEDMINFRKWLFRRYA